ncbi:unnamed protein product [Caenorhabditis brenneri]
MVSSRYPIETWSRPQLEDKFHSIVAELQNAQKKVKEQEKQITTFNSRFRRSMLERKSREDQVVERSKYDDVVKENKILDMKLKAAKQQLLIYTAPSARATTASMMTGRSTFRQPPSTYRQRIPLTAGTGSIDRPPSAPVTRKKSEAEKLQLATDDKLAIVRLNRTLKSKNEEIAELKYTIEKIKQHRGNNNSVPPSRPSTSSSTKSSSNNNNDDEEKDSELEEMSEMIESDRSTPVIEEKKSRRGSNGTKKNGSVHHPPPRIPDQTEKVLMDKLKIAENDLAMLKEECELVKKANERLVQQSLSKSTEYGARESIEEKKKIVELEENLKEVEKKIRESEHKRREDQKKFEAMRLHYKTKYENLKAEKKRMNSVTTVAPVAPKPVKVEEDDREDSPPPIFYEPVRKRQSQSDISKMRKADDDLLQKLYREVADILNSHDVGIAEMSALGSGKESVGKWQKLYSELYEELEKVRNMLVIQYDINQKQTKEINILKEELERLKIVSTDTMAKSKDELEEKQKKIFMLEEQIRAIAYSGQQPVKLLSNEINLPNPSVNTDLIVKLVHVKPAPALTSKFFFSMEFFDFQLETSPILDPREQNIEFTTVYDVLVSNLLIHYLQRNGIVIEMYRPANDSYKLLAAATISMIPLFEDSVLRKFCSEIVMKSVESGVEMCTLRYEIEVSQPISDSFKKFKTSEVARNMMPLKLENTEIEESDFEPLTIMVNRIVGLESLGKERSTEFCVVYEFLTFSPYFTEFSTNPEIRSQRDLYIPKNDIARNLFTSSSISFFLIENIPKQDGVVAILHLPLHSLCKLGGSIKGTFPMLDTNGRPTSVSLDICLLWKHEIPSFFLKPEPAPNSSFEESKKDTPILPQPVRRTSKQFDVTPVSENEPILRETVPEPPVPAVVPPPVVPQTTVIPIKVPSPPQRDSSSSSRSDEFNPSATAKAPLSPENDDFQPRYPFRAEDEEDRIVFDDDDDIESVSAISSQRDPEPPTAPKESAPSPPKEPVPESVTPREPSPEVQEPPSEDTPRPQDPNPVTSNDDPKTPLIESRESTPASQKSVEEVVEPVPEQKPEEQPEEYKRRELNTEELKSLLGVLPPIAKPRNIPVGPLTLTEEPTTSTRAINSTGRITFNPETQVKPPSEASSTSSPRQRPPVPLPHYTGPSLVKVPKPLSPTDKNVLEPDMKLTLQLESFELIPGSSFTKYTRDGTKCFVDWCLLDFSNEQSKSTVFDFPRRQQEMVDLDFSKEYTLTRGQVALLNQWISLMVKLEFTIIRINPDGDEEIAIGSIILAPNNTQMKSVVVDMLKGDTTEAELTITIHFSRALLEQLT